MTTAPSTYLTGNERLLSPDLNLHDATVLDFWRWAWGDLSYNDIRGVFAEWLAARILDLDLTGHVRDSWAGCDLVTPEGVRIEVKTAAYVQAWEHDGPSKIVFTGLRAHTQTSATAYSSSATYNADLYIFCLHTGTDKATWTCLDLAQWRFYLLPRDILERRGMASISLGPLSALTPALSAAELRVAARTAIETISARGSGPDELLALSSMEES